MILDKLYTIIIDRRKNLPPNSYVASLFKKGKDSILQKIGEEATEVVIAAKNKKREEIISEVADLCFHLLILLSYFNIKPDDILEELESRM